MDRASDARMLMRIERAADAGVAAERAAALIAERVHAAVEARGRAAIALSGGTTPAAMLRRLGARDLPWLHVHVFQVDERCVARGDPARNLDGILEALAPSRIPPDQMYPMPVDEPDPAAAHVYADTLRAVLGAPVTLDVVHLGLGTDGHTASLVPGDAALEAAGDVAVTAPYRGARRMTMTLPILNRARLRVWLVTGRAKQPVLERFAGGDAVLVAASVRRDDTVVIADADAAGALCGTSP